MRRSSCILGRFVTRAAARRGAAQAVLGVVALLVVGAPSLPCRADPVLTFSRTPQAGGLVRHDVAVNFQDGLSRSGFIQITFSSNFDASSSFALASWPDIQQVTTNPTVYSLQGGTGGGSQVDVVDVAQLVGPQGLRITYNAVVSRDGQNFVLVPEPSAPAAAGLCLALVALLRARRRERRDA